MNREFENAITAEVAKFSDASVSFDMGGKHPQAKLTFDGLIKKVSFSGTPSDRFALKKALGDIRRGLRMMGAERGAPETTEEDEAVAERVYHKPNEGAAKRLHLVQAEPAREPVTLPERIVASLGTLADVVPAPVAKPRLVAEPHVDQDAEAREALQAQVDAVQDGIYFGLPDTIYHAVRALGSGALCDLIVSPATFWRGSWMDPDRPELDEEQTAAQLIGKAYHCARLEPQDFETRFVREPSKDDFPRRGMITSDQAVKAALKEAGAQQTVSGETNEERAERLEDLGYPGVIWPLEYARWAAEVGKRDPIPVPLKAKTWDDITIDMERFHKSEVAKLLEGGASEVSVFWTDEHGLRCKARFDKLLCGHWVDFKTFANPNGKVLDQAVSDAFRFNRYYVQAVHYFAAAEAIRIGGLQVQGEATDDLREMIDEIQLSPTGLACWYVFQEKGGIPNLLARQFQLFAEDNTARAIRELEESGASEDHLERARHFAEVAGSQPRPTAIAGRGRVEIERAKAVFALYSMTYALGEPWAPIDPMGTISDDDFNPKWLESGQ